MAKKTAPLLPSTDELLFQFGARLRMARLRRRLPAKQLAERAGMSPMTLRSLERGGSGVTIGAYLAVMQVLGIENDLNLLAKADPVGRELQDARLPAHSKTTSGPRPSFARTSVQRTRSAPIGSEQLHKAIEALPTENAHGWIEKSGFSSSEGLSQLIESSAPLSKKGR